MNLHEYPSKPCRRLKDVTGNRDPIKKFNNDADKMINSPICTTVSPRIPINAMHKITVIVMTPERQMIEYEMKRFSFLLPITRTTLTESLSMIIPKILTLCS